MLDLRMPQPQAQFKHKQRHMYACFQALQLVHQDEICSCIVAANRNEGQSAQPVEAQEEAPEPQDGSLWWHGMFIRAGRMGNMASDVRSDGQEQGKKVLHTPLSIDSSNQSTTFLSWRLIREVRRQLLGKQHTSSMTHLMVVISAVNNSFNSSQHIYCTPSDQVITVLSSCLHDLTSHMPMLQDNLVQLMCPVGILCRGVRVSHFLLMT